MDADVEKELITPLKRFVGNLGEDALAKFCLRYRKKWGVADYSNNKPSKHLPYKDPALQSIRDHVDAKTSSGEVHERLVLNFDQVWTTLMEPDTKIIGKGTKRSGQEADPLAHSKFKRKPYIITCRDR